MHFLILTLLAGCTTTQDLAYLETVCDEAVTDVAWDDASLGFTAADVLAALGADLQLDLSWTELTPDATSATLQVAIAQHSTLTPAVVVRTDAADREGGCGEDQGEGTFLRIPLELAASDPAGGLSISEPGPFEDGVFELDAGAASADSVWFYWEFGVEEPLEDTFGGDWLAGAESCVEEKAHGQEYDYRETRLVLWGTPAAGQADIDVGFDTEDAVTLGACWRGVWGDASW
ncbi:MAG: hypothetical protein ABIO70_32100 [Pseudomonadota bacterium]